MPIINYVHLNNLQFLPYTLGIYSNEKKINVETGSEGPLQMSAQAANVLFPPFNLPLVLINQKQ